MKQSLKMISKMVSNKTIFLVFTRFVIDFFVVVVGVVVQYDVFLDLVEYLFKK